MHIERITFDRVFSIYQRTDRHRGWTDFGFQAGTTKVYSAQVAGHPVIREGTTLAVAMPKPQAWGSIYGWAVLDAKQVVVEGANADPRPLLLLMLAANVLFLPLAVMRWKAGGTYGPIASASMAIVPNLLLAAPIARIAAQNRAYKALMEYLSQSTAD